MKRKKIQDKKKVLFSFLALALTAAIMLTGTFAWQSISQEALNEIGENGLNVGGRLHDDFDGENKDIYVENFGNEPILARVRLDEYMEIGSGAGTKDGDEGDNKATPVVADTDIDDVGTWTTHIPAATDVTDCDKEGTRLHTYFDWEMGGSTIFMPTFNKNKDSLAADVNGTWGGPDGDPNTEEDNFTDYQEYTDKQQVTGDAVYDADDNNVDEGEDSQEGTNHKTVEETHIAKPTQTGTVITMAKWKEDGSKPGKYWVYDTDGWAYWAEAIQPGEATGLLLSKISLKKEMMDDWYYGINAVAQFATDDDLGDDVEDTGFYQDGLTDDAYYLLMMAAGHKETVEITTADNADEVLPGNTLQFTAKITLGGRVFGSQEVDWSISSEHDGGTSINDSGLLTVAAGETNAELTIKAASKTKPELFAEKTVKTGKTYEDIATITPGSTETVNIDGIQWYVLAKDDEKVLIWSEYLLRGVSGTYHGGNWEKSQFRSSLQSWLETTDTLKEIAIETDILTRVYNQEEWKTTRDKIFILTEADIFGTIYSDTPTSDSRDYTYGNTPLITNYEVMMKDKNAIQWLRSPGTSSNDTALIRDGGVAGSATGSIAHGAHAALWVPLP